METTHKCKDCKHYVRISSSPRTEYWEKYNYCGYKIVNQFNHEIEVTGNLSWNEKGNCKKFEGKQQELN